MMELSSSEMSDLTRATRRNITEDGIHHSHRRENLKSDMWSQTYKLLTHALHVMEMFNLSSANTANTALHFHNYVSPGAQPVPYQWVQRALNPREKRPRLQAGHSPPTSVEVYNTWTAVGMVGAADPPRPLISVF
jgi:hypothetical protein